jgi:hypothetical protein
METGNEKEAVQYFQPKDQPQSILLAQTPPGITIGVVTDSEPSSLSLLASGVAGMAVRRARRERTKAK